MEDRKYTALEYIKNLFSTKEKKVSTPFKIRRLKYNRDYDLGSDKPTLHLRKFKLQH